MTSVAYSPLHESDAMSINVVDIATVGSKSSLTIGTNHFIMCIAMSVHGGDGDGAHDAVVHGNELGFGLANDVVLVLDAVTIEHYKFLQSCLRFHRSFHLHWHPLDYTLDLLPSPHPQNLHLPHLHRHLCHDHRFKCTNPVLLDSYSSLKDTSLIR